MRTSQIFLVVDLEGREATSFPQPDQQRSVFSGCRLKSGSVDRWITDAMLLVHDRI
jgi:hypothetical protein